LLKPDKCEVDLGNGKITKGNCIKKGQTGTFDAISSRFLGGLKKLFICNAFDSGYSVVVITLESRKKSFSTVKTKNFDAISKSKPYRNKEYVTLSFLFVVDPGSVSPTISQSVR
jgi:hypothetical protein